MGLYTVPGIRDSGQREEELALTLLEKGNRVQNSPWVVHGGHLMLNVTVFSNSKSAGRLEFHVFFCRQVCLWRSSRQRQHQGSA